MTTLYYHNTNKPFKTFQPKPCFFSLSMEETLGHMGNHPGSTSLVAVFNDDHNPLIMSVTSLKRDAEAWWGEDYIYSMLDPAVGEFDPEKVVAYRQHLANGWDAVYVDDYSFNSDKDAINLLVFRPDLVMRISHVIKTV